MNFTLTITASQELLDAVKMITGFTATTVPSKIISIPEAKAPEAVEVKEAPTKKAPVKVSKEEKAPEKGLTLEMVRAAVQEKATAGKREEVKTLLSEFEVSRVTDLLPESYQSFIEKLSTI